MPRTLVFCSAGARIAGLPWLAGLAGQPDVSIALVHYGADAVEAPAGVTYFANNRDFKVPNFVQLARQHPQVLDHDLYLFIDDDIVASAQDLLRWRDLALEGGIDVSQPALSPQSKADWPHVKLQDGLGTDRGQYVEIMCFALSRRALQHALPFFFMVKTGTGLDLALYRLAARLGWSTAVLHGVTVLHPWRDESNTVRRQFDGFARFNIELSRFLDFCLPPGDAGFDDIVAASRVLGDTRPETVRRVAWVRFVAARLARALGRALGRGRPG